MEITLYCKGKLNSPPRKKRERRHVGYVAQWPGQEADAALKSSCKKLPRTWEETEEWQHDHSSLQDSTELADQRGGKGSKRQQTFFFFIGKIIATVDLLGCCCQKGGNSLTFPLQQLPHLCFPITSCPLLIPNGAHQTGIPLTHPLSFCHIPELNVAADRVWRVLELPGTKEVPEVCTRNRKEETAGISCYQPLILQDSIKSPHAISNYLELLKLSEYKLSFKDRTTWKDLCVTFCIGGVFQNHTEENAFSEDYSTAGVQKNYPFEK